MTRPSATIGTYNYWRLEVWEFLKVTKVETDVDILDRAFRALTHLYLNTRCEDDASQEFALVVDYQAMMSTYERRRFQRLLAAVQTD